MAKYVPKKKHDGKLLQITTPSRYGSHRSMVIDDQGEKVLCRDDEGEYWTTADRLDNGLMDSNRMAQVRFR